ncbi:MAG: hypothetical protein FWE45_04740 [Firmicutes bacterium]|nr:hypothetical protein [Bacillota bacterium]
MRTKDKVLSDYLEAELGEKLNKRMVKRTKRAIDRADKERYQAQESAKSISQPNFLFRYAITAIVTAVICLSIVLPITLPRGTTFLTPPSPEPMIYTDNITSIPLMELQVRSIPGLLLFSTYQKTLFGTIPWWGDSWVELADDAPLILSYKIAESMITLENGNMFVVDYRIRTHRYYYFFNYYPGFYSTLEMAHMQHVNEVTEQIHAFNINEQEVDRETIVSGFAVDGIAIFAHARYTFDIGLNIVRNTLVHFTLGGNCYFIRFTEIFGEEVSTSLDNMIEIVKDTILPALFQNLDD